MADLQKIKLNGIEYNFKDAAVRFIDIPLTLSYDSVNDEYNLTYTGSNIEDINKNQARLMVTCPDNTIKIFYRMVNNYNSFSTLDASDSLGLSSISYDGTSFSFSYVNVMNLVDYSVLANAIGNINQFEVAIVTNLPTTDIDAHTIYFKSNSSSGNNIYDEYMYINNNWELIGSTQVDLSNYLQSSDIAAWAKAANKPTYTASEVGALPDTTVIPAATTVTNTLSSGTLIATINGTNIYAPAYTDADGVSY